MDSSAQPLSSLQVQFVGGKSDFQENFHRDISTTAKDGTFVLCIPYQAKGSLAFKGSEGQKTISLSKERKKTPMGGKKVEICDLGDVQYP